MPGSAVEESDSILPHLSPPYASQASGILKGFDPLLNLVLDGTIEYMRGKLLWLLQGCHQALLLPHTCGITLQQVVT